MARYIDAEKLTAFLCQKRCGDDRAFCGDTMVCGLVLAVKDFPTADVAEVVRCKECRHLEILNGQEYYARCKWHGRLFDSFGNADTRTWFCADGERRTDEEPT